MGPILLATDLDRTLVGDDDSLADLNILLNLLMGSGKLKLAYITGRSLASYEYLAKNHPLIRPDAVVAAVGTEIYWLGMDMDTGWPIDLEWDREEIVDRLEPLQNLTYQSTTDQRPYKVSYYLKDDPALLEQVKRKLSDLKVDILYSHGEYLDILPVGVNKGSALKHLASRWGIEHKNIITCGDSGNDIDMLKDHKGIIVGNAHQELLDWVKSLDMKTDAFVAKSEYAAGIKEGLSYYGITA